MSVGLNRYRAAADKKGIRYCLVEEGPRIDGIGTKSWGRLVELPLAHRRLHFQSRPEDQQSEDRPNDGRFKVAESECSHRL